MTHRMCRCCARSGWPLLSPTPIPAPGQRRITRHGSAGGCGAVREVCDRLLAAHRRITDQDIDLPSAHRCSALVLAVVAVWLTLRRACWARPRPARTGRAVADQGYSATDATVVETGADGLPMYTLQARQVQQDPDSNRSISPPSI